MDAAVWMLEAADRIEELSVAYVQADHIEELAATCDELKAKLAKAVEFIEDLTGCEWPYCEDAKRVLAELKGQDVE